MHGPCVIKQKAWQFRWHIVSVCAQCSCSHSHTHSHSAFITFTSNMLFACFVCVCVFIFHEYLMMVLVAFMHTLCVHSIKPNESSQISGIAEVLYKCLFCFVCCCYFTELVIEIMRKQWPSECVCEIEINNSVSFQFPFPF